MAKPKEFGTAYSAEDLAMDDDGGKTPWFSVCNKHSTFIGAKTRQIASKTRTTDFCDSCREGA